MTVYHFGLVGHPLSHSLSPQIHSAALKACGLQGDYSLFPIYPHDRQGLKDLLARIRSGQIDGLNITMPHKRNVIPFMDKLTPTANTIGAVNTIYMREDKLIGDNTDAPGFLSDLKKNIIKFRSPIMGKGSGMRALVLGAGGSARAVVYALVNDGWNVVIAARLHEQAKQLAGQYIATEALELNSRTFKLLKVQLIVNTTPLGSGININTSPLPDNITLPRDMMVYDLVYNPRETKLVRNAKRHGCHAVTGLGMLIEQAALAFETWTGHSPPREILYQAAES